MNKILHALCESVINGDRQKAKKLSKKALEKGIDAYEAITDGLSKGMDTVGEKYEKGEFFVPELMRAADTMSSALEILEPRIKIEEANNSGVAVVGTVRGDIHDIGEKLVVTILNARGFTVYDLGVDVSKEKFIETIKETDANYLLMSALTTTTRNYMGEVIKELQREGMRNKVKVIVGGVMVSEDFAKRIGADSYLKNAIDLIKIGSKKYKDCRGTS
jgi:corrinoid protein of di/trimethylamine methyltransferase